MKDDELISAIRATADIKDVDHCVDAARATLTVLGQRLAGGETCNLAAQLPPMFARWLPDQGGAEAFDLDEFYQRVAAAESGDCTAEQARKHARAVMAGVKASVSAGEFNDVATQLPNTYADLLGTGPLR